MTDILNQVDATLQAVMERNAARFDLSAGGEVASGSTSACAMRWAPHAEDGIEEVPAVPEPGPLLTLADVASTAFECAAVPRRTGRPTSPSSAPGTWRTARLRRGWRASTRSRQVAM